MELPSVHSVDVVIVDYVMPEMNGQEAAIEMKRVNPHAPIIMLSGNADVPEQALKSAARVHHEISFRLPARACNRPTAGGLIQPPMRGKLDLRRCCCFIRSYDRCRNP